MPQKKPAAPEVAENLSEEVSKPEVQAETAPEINRNPALAALEDGPFEYFLEGKKPAGFDKTYGKEADADLIEVANKHFNVDDKFLYLFNARDNMRFTIIVPIKWSNMDDTMRKVYRVDARSVLLKPGAEAGMLEEFCKKVVAQLKYNKVR